MAKLAKQHIFLLAVRRKAYRVVLIFLLVKHYFYSEAKWKFRSGFNRISNSFFLELALQQLTVENTNSIIHVNVPYPYQYRGLVEIPIKETRIKYDCIFL